MGVFAVCACYWTWTDSLRFFWIIEKKLPNSCLKTRVQHFEVYVGRHSRLTPLVCFHKCFCPEFLPSDQGCSCVPDVVACFMEADHHVTQYYRSHRDVKIAHTYTLFVLLWTILHLIYSRYSSSSSYKKVKGSRPNWFELDKWIRPFKERTYARIWWFLFVTSEPPHPPKKNPNQPLPPPKKKNLNKRELQHEVLENITALVYSGYKTLSSYQKVRSSRLSWCWVLICPRANHLTPFNLSVQYGHWTC